MEFELNRIRNSCYRGGDFMHFGSTNLNKDPIPNPPFEADDKTKKNQPKIKQPVASLSWNFKKKFIDKNNKDKLINRIKLKLLISFRVFSF